MLPPYAEQSDWARVDIPLSFKRRSFKEAEVCRGERAGIFGWRIGIGRPDAGPCEGAFR